MARLKIRSQLEVDEEARKGLVWDDCGPSSAACAASWVLGLEISAKQGIAAKATATGFTEKQGVSDNGSSLSELAKTVKVLGAHGRYPSDWQDAVQAAKDGAALIINVDQAKMPFYEGVTMSKWHRKYVKAHPGYEYGHMTAAAFDPVDGWMWACPTMSGKGDEEFAVSVTEAQVKQIASSKGDAPKNRVLIVSAKK
ncbi:MAG: hypothetical protein EBR82_20720 [Caulobacteraceae bacterium]|nr:hypothetical protein [Caulobacteraceae bacterium]